MSFINLLAKSADPDQTDLDVQSLPRVYSPNMRGKYIQPLFKREFYAKFTIFITNTCIFLDPSAMFLKGIYLPNRMI